MARYRKNKYNNQRTVVGGYPDLVFDSRIEAKHFLRLKEMERSGEITELNLQPKFKLSVNDCKICNYIADFSYRGKDGELVIEDVKSPQTSKNPVFRLKKKLMKAVLNIEVHEIL